MKIPNPAPAWRVGLLLALAALVIAAVLLLLHLYAVKTSSIDNIDELHYELGCRIGHFASCVDDWLWEPRTPYKYRALGRLSVWALYQANLAFGMSQDQAIYCSYVALSFLFTALCLFLLGLLTRQLVGRVHPELPSASRFKLAGLAMLLFAASPPILFFVKYPVRGWPNDLIGYALMLAALYCLSIRRIAWFSVLGIIAVFCRETTLLVSFIFLLFYPYPIRRKLLAALLPPVVYVLYRLLWPGAYDAFAGGRLNLSVPLETASFLLLTFGPLWILGVFGHAGIRKSEVARSDPFVHALVASFPWSVLLTLGIVSAFASIWEIRILFLLFFYFIPFAVLGLYQRWTDVVGLFRNKYVLLYLLAALVVVFRFWVWMHPLNVDEFVRRADLFDIVFFGYLNRPQYNWISILAIYLWLFLACLPLLSLAGKADAAGPDARQGR